MRARKALAGRGRVALGFGLLLATIALPVTVFADGGLYSQTQHGSPTSGVRRDPALPQGNCVQCHSGHGQNPEEFGLFAPDDNNLCFTCHTAARGSYSGQTAYTSSGHAASTASLDQQPVGKCTQCHNPHGAGDARGLYAHQTARSEERVCYTCHGSSFRPQGAADIETPSTRRYGHNEAAYERLHDDAAEFNAAGGGGNPALSGASRHVECADCHNTHEGRTAPRPARSSNIGEMLLGSWGVRPLYSGAPWLPPTSYITERFQNTGTEYESYLCFKCHSGYAFGNVPPYTADGVPETNTAMEFSPANPSYHNVTGQPETSVPAEAYVYGTASPPAFVNGWSPKSAMACTDCHASDPSAGNDRGPHGSIYSFMLKKRFKAQAGAYDNTGRIGTQSDLCFDCHDWNTYGEGGSGTATNFRSATKNLHAMAGHAEAGCFQCHAAVPHGFKRKHMIVYVSDGAPYYQSDPTNYALKKGGIEAYSHAEGGSYTINSCKAGCHDGHQQSMPVNPLP